MRIFNIFLCLGLLLTLNVHADSRSVELHAETWDISRQGEALLRVPELSSIIRLWMTDPAQNIELRYPGGEEGELWVEELKDWMVSLGVPSSAIEPVPGSDAQDVINILIRKP